MVDLGLKEIFYIWYSLGVLGYVIFVIMLSLILGLNIKTFFKELMYIDILSALVMVVGIFVVSLFLPLLGPVLLFLTSLSIYEAMND